MSQMNDCNDNISCCRLRLAPVAYCLLRVVTMLSAYVPSNDSTQALLDTLTFSRICKLLNTRIQHLKYESDDC